MDDELDVRDFVLVRLMWDLSHYVGSLWSICLHYKAPKCKVGNLTNERMFQSLFYEKKIFLRSQGKCRLKWASAYTAMV